MKKKNYEETIEDFWKDIVYNEDGTLNEEQVKKELHDFKVVIDEVSKAYDVLTMGMLSKPMTKHEHIVAEVERQTDERIRDEVKCALEDYQYYLLEQGFDIKIIKFLAPYLKQNYTE